MTQKYVLTGGPSSGKSSILLSLEAQNEYIIREAAEDHIKLRQAQGCNQPWLEEGFQNKILDLQLQRESKIPKNIERVFIDRGVFDGLAYVDEKSSISERIRTTCKKYDGIFLIEKIGNTEKNEVRRENHDEAMKLENTLQKIYQNLGYNPIRIPFGTVDDRSGLVLSYL